MKSFSKKKLAYAVSLLLLPAGTAGAAVEITGPVTSQDQIDAKVTDSQEDIYIYISSKNTDTPGINATSTGITIGGNDTQSIEVTSEQYIGIISYGNNSGSSNVTLEAEEDITVTGNSEGYADYGSGINASAYSLNANDEVTATVTLSAGGSNYVSGGTGNKTIQESDDTHAGSLWRSIYGHGINAYSFTYSVDATAEVILEAGADNVVTGGENGSGDGIHAYSSANSSANEEDITVAASAVKLDAGNNNEVTGSDNGISAEAFSFTNHASTSEVNLTAGQGNKVEGGESGIYSSAVFATNNEDTDTVSDDSSAKSKVTLTAEEGDNEVIGGSYGIYAVGKSNPPQIAQVDGESVSTAITADSEVTLTADRGSNLVTGSYSHYGIYAQADISAGVGGTTTTIVTLDAEVANVITLTTTDADEDHSTCVNADDNSSDSDEDNSAAIYSYAHSATQGESDAESIVTLTARGDGGYNHVEGGDNDYGIYAYGWSFSNHTAGSTVTLDAQGDKGYNYVKGGQSGIYARTQASADESAAAYPAEPEEYDDSSSFAITTVTLTALGDEGSNYVSSGSEASSDDDRKYSGIHAYAHGDATGETTVTLEAGRNNIVYGADYGIYAQTNASINVYYADGENGATDYGGNYAIVEGKMNSAVALTALQGDNIVTGGTHGIYAEAQAGISAEKLAYQTVLDNLSDYTEVANAISAYKQALNNNSNTEGTNDSAVQNAINNYLNALDAAVKSVDVSGVNYSEDPYATSAITLTAEHGNNVVTGNNYGIYASSSVEAEAAVTLTAENGINFINATDEEGIAIYATGSGSSVVAYGTAVLDAATGAIVEDGSKVAFYDDVIAYTQTVARADGEGSKVTFENGLSNEDYYASEEIDSIIQALNGGTVAVNAGGSGIVKYYGTTAVTGDGSDEGFIYMTLGSGSAWYMTGDSSATALALSSGGLLDMTADKADKNDELDILAAAPAADTGSSGFSSLTLNTLSNGGNNTYGTIRMDLGPSGTNSYGNSDIIYVNDEFTGVQYVEFAGWGMGDPRYLDGLGDRITGLNLSPDPKGTVLLVSAATGDNNTGILRSKQYEGTLFWQAYEISAREATDEADQAVTEHYISGIAHTDPDVRETTSVSTVMSAASLSYYSWMMQNTKLLRRLGDLRQGTHDADNGAWARISGSKLDLNGQHGFENKYIQFEAGYDRVVAQDSEYTLYGGVALTCADGESTYNRGSGDNYSTAVSVYFTLISEAGSYLDLVFKYGRWENDFTVYDTNNYKIEGDTDSIGFSLSAEFGRKFRLNEDGLYIEPQAQLTFGYFDGDNYTLSNGINVDVDGVKSLVGRAGSNFGWDITPRANVYLKANVLTEFLGDYDVTMRDYTGTVNKSGDYRDTWFMYGLGGSFKLGDSGSFLYLDVERSAGGDLDQEWFFNAGFRFVF